MLEDATGQFMEDLMRELYPICRSITGNGVRQTLSILGQHIPLEIHEVPSGTPVFDWTVPKEWNIRDAYILDPRGRKIVDFQKSNLHVLSYSTPIAGKFPLAELKKHLFSLPEFPDWIPYLTSYYKENWGFCLSHRQLESLEEGEYEVCIDSTLENGSLTYGEILIPGVTEEEFLLSCYVCHPSLCNDNLSGVVLLTALARYLRTQKLRYSYRLLFIPETIGAITWLSRNESQLSRIRHGLVATCVGDPGHLRYKKSRRGNAPIDRIVSRVLKASGEPHEELEFFPMGSDERQFCSPGFNLPVGSLMRTPYIRFPEYHTSADNLELVRARFLADTFSKYVKVIAAAEAEEVYVSTNPKGEPQLGRRGLYQDIGATKGGSFKIASVMWVLNLSDGDHSIEDISEQSGMPLPEIKAAADALLAKGLLRSGARARS
jgi:aminopeptidase-like protein